MASETTGKPRATAERGAEAGARIGLDRDELDSELTALERHWAVGAERSAARWFERRRARTRDRVRKAAAVVGLLAVAGAIVLVGFELPAGDAVDGPGAKRSAAVAPPDPGRATPPSQVRAAVYPEHGQIAAARTFARSREGPVSFAVVDSRGGEHALEGDRRYVSASVVKAMLLIAEIDRLKAGGLPLDTGTRSYLARMITVSDNAAADAIYSRVGDAGLVGVARRAGLERFTVAGYWANAELTASDMAQLMARVDELLAGPNASFASTLLERVVAEQRWGIPAAVAGDGWRQRFKGGWRSTERGQLVHQVANLERGRNEISIAVLSNGAPTMGYGIATVRGIAERLLNPPPAPRDRRAPWRARWES